MGYQSLYQWRKNPQFWSFREIPEDRFSNQLRSGAISATPFWFLPDYKMAYEAHPRAVIDTPCEIGDGTKIWHFAHICQGARIGRNCVFGQNTMVGNNVVIGSNVKVQNNVAIYTGTTIEDDVFLGPSCVLTNVTNPRSQVKRHALYETTIIRRGATVGANATIVCGITLGRYCFISAGAVVVKDVPDYALIVGVPGRQRGWMSRHGHVLQPDADGFYECPEAGFVYRIDHDENGRERMRCLDLDEETPLPENLAEGKISYDDFKTRHQLVPRHFRQEFNPNDNTHENPITRHQRSKSSA